MRPAIVTTPRTLRQVWEQAYLKGRLEVQNKEATWAIVGLLRWQQIAARAGYPPQDIEALAKAGWAEGFAAGSEAYAGS